MLLILFKNFKQHRSLQQIKQAAALVKKAVKLNEKDEKKKKENERNGAEKEAYTANN